MTEQCRSNDYYDFVINLFFSDTIELIDNILTDAQDDPHYSAVMAFNRLYAYLKLTSDSDRTIDEQAIVSLLQHSGYNKEDVQLLLDKKGEEEPIHRGELFYKPQ